MARTRSRSASTSPVSSCTTRGSSPTCGGCSTETGLEPSLLTLELTESILVKKQRVEAILTELRELGVGIAIDDFGTGYSSLSYLQNFPATSVKIDRSFVSTPQRRRRHRPRPQHPRDRQRARPHDRRGGCRDGRAARGAERPRLRPGAGLPARAPLEHRGDRRDARDDARLDDGRTQAHGRSLLTAPRFPAHGGWGKPWRLRARSVELGQVCCGRVRPEGADEAFGISVPVGRARDLPL